MSQNSKLKCLISLVFKRDWGGDGGWEWREFSAEAKTDHRFEKGLQAAWQVMHTFEIEFIWTKKSLFCVGYYWGTQYLDIQICHTCRTLSQKSWSNIWLRLPNISSHRLGSGGFSSVYLFEVILVTCLNWLAIWILLNKFHYLLDTYKQRYTTFWGQIFIQCFCLVFPHCRKWRLGVRWRPSSRFPVCPKYSCERNIFNHCYTSFYKIFQQKKIPITV